jgi:hypothetical protein
MERFDRPAAPDIRVEAADLTLLPQPRTRIRSINSFNERRAAAE